VACHNVQQMAHPTVTPVRRELDKKLTVLVLLQVIVYIFTLLPHTTVNSVSTNANLTTDSIIQTKLEFNITVTLMIYYSPSAVSVK
jgi:hypothetical protein